MNTAETITTLIAGKAVELAFIGAGLMCFRTIASRLSLAAVKQQPQQPKRETQAEAPPAAAAEPETATVEELLDRRRTG